MIPKFDFEAPNGIKGNGINSSIAVHLLDDRKMRGAGFIDNQDSWALFRHVGDRKYDITFDLVIPKDTPDVFRLDVLDENFGQPYDYQHILRNNPSCLPALAVWLDIEKIMAQLAACGIVTGHAFGDYI